MTYIKSFLMNYWYYFIMIILVCGLIGTCCLCYYFYSKPFKCPKKSSEVTIEEVGDTDCWVDVKGAVNKPGVYKISCDKLINDVIVLSGGTTKKAFLNNINLSKKVSNEMVIYVYTKSELNNSEPKEVKSCNCEKMYIDSCIKQDSSIIENKSSKNDNEVIKDEDVIESGLISINNATKEQLMTLPGIGEAKANSIITYRENNDGFKIIEDLKNVSGIGTALFEQIKEFIDI